MIFENEYGKLEIEPVSPIKQVAEIFGKDIPEDIKFALDTAEKIVLITENRKSQIGFQSTNQCYLVIHPSPETAYVARIKSLSFNAGISARAEIVRCAQVTGPGLCHW